MFCTGTIDYNFFKIFIVFSFIIFALLINIFSVVSSIPSKISASAKTLKSVWKSVNLPKTPAQACPNLQKFCSNVTITLPKSYVSLPKFYQSTAQSLRVYKNLLYQRI